MGVPSEKAYVELQLGFERENAAQKLKGLYSEVELNGNSTDLDVYGKGEGLNDFEADVTQVLGMQAGMFCISGVMAQLITLKIHLAQPRRNLFAIHGSSHLEIHEHKSYEHLLGMRALLIGEAHRVITWDDFIAAVEPSVSDGQSNLGAVILELPQRENGGVCVEWDDLVNIREWCTTYGVLLHMDGARLWEAQPYYGRSLPELCSLFDSVYVSFYKGLGGMAAAMLCGKYGFIEEARIWLRRFGGNLYTVLPYMAIARRQWRALLPSFPERQAKLVEVVAAVSLLPGCAAVLRFEPPVPQSSMVHLYVKGVEQAPIMSARDQVCQSLGISVLPSLRPRKFVISDEDMGGFLWYSEWNMGPLNKSIPTDTYIEGFRAFINFLNAAYSTQE